MLDDYLTIDVIFPMTDMWLLPYLKNACASIRSQNYPQDKVRILVSWSPKNPWAENTTPLKKFCETVGARIIKSRWVDPAFSIARTYNVAARAGDGDVVACFDADVVFYPHTFAMAHRFLKDTISCVIPVGRTSEGPESEIFRMKNISAWKDLCRGLEHRRIGIGNMMVPRPIYEYIHGYDERFYGWGAADTDFYRRVTRAGGTAYLLDHGCLLSLHQLHPLSETRESQYTARNRGMLNTDESLVRNPESWGGQPSEEPVEFDRPHRGTVACVEAMGVGYRRLLDQDAGRKSIQFVDTIVRSHPPDVMMEYGSEFDEFTRLLLGSARQADVELVACGRKDEVAEDILGGCSVVNDYLSREPAKSTVVRKLKLKRRGRLS